MKIAVLSDIHGNYWALTKVLKDIECRKPDIIINLGDILYGPLMPKQTYDLLKSYNILSISGNQDRNIVENHEKADAHYTLKYVVSEINDEILSWLGTLPKTKTISPDLFICHGTPAYDTTYMLEALKEGFKTVNDDSVIDGYLKDVSQQFVFCGHSHTHRIVQTPKHIIINPGSVGLPAYDDEHPIYHKTESFNPFTQYSLIEIQDSEFIINQINLPYEHEKAAACASQNNRLDWAKWLMGGKV
jgi:predicted phosphodiesterase